MKVIVNNQNNKIVTVNRQGTSEVVSIGIQGPPGIGGDIRLDDLYDVELPTVVPNGSLLVYKSETSKWVSSTTLNAQNVDAGEF
jgi:predicted 2-oxoglutarate/Fe(II)-dependent dioxygenase YbiX